jgi:phospholipase C
LEVGAMKCSWWCAFVFLVALTGCAQHAGTPALPALPVAAPAELATAKIRHVVIIFQENRSTDNLFNGLPGADTVRSGLNSHGRKVPLHPVSLTAPYDLGHEHFAFEKEYASGRMNGFDRARVRCYSVVACARQSIRAYGYVPHDQVRPYVDMAMRYTFADRMFQTNQGPSFPAHQYILSGTSTIANNSGLRAAENPVAGTGGCDSPAGTLVELIDQAGQEGMQVYPCFDRLSLTDLLERKSLSWRYYQGFIGPGLWNAPDAILHIRESRDYLTHVIAPPSRVLLDVKRGALADVVWVTPTGLASDHAGGTNGSGPSWVAAVVNTIGKSRYWKDTAIFVTWDDWGGWYDHVRPPVYNSYELGFRVPLIVISPYAKHHYVSHVQYEFGSILKFTEETFGLGSLHTTDVRANDLSDCFDFSKPPTKFRSISAPLPPSYFLKQPIDRTDPDDDF